MKFKLLYKIDGEGYYVFEHLNCMQRGEHIEYPFDNQTRNVTSK